jgi:hypothetical protein
MRRAAGVGPVLKERVGLKKVYLLMPTAYIGHGTTEEEE